MAIQIQGNSGTVLEVDGGLFRAARSALRPIDYGVLGAYRVSGVSGTMGAGLGANTEIFQFRWTDATRLAAVTSVTLDGLGGSATVFTAGFGNVSMSVARSWTTDGSGGTTLTPTVNNQKMRTSMASSLVTAAIRVASTAALGVGVKTIDNAPIGLFTMTFGTAASVQYAQRVDLLRPDPGVEHPLILGVNEGFVVRATVPATGTWQFGVSCAWTEIASY